jgi:hypothetical protein
MSGALACLDLGRIAAFLHVRLGGLAYGHELKTGFITGNKIVRVQKDGYKWTERNTYKLTEDE